jgi:hypothetical protein
MSDTRVFNESVFHSYANLQNFFNQSPAIQQVVSKKNEPYAEVPVPVDAKLACQWQICQIASAPFRWTFAILLESTADGLELCGQTQVAKEMKNWAVHLVIGFDVLSEETTKIFKIATSVNQPNQEGEIVNDHPQIPESRVDDQRVRKRAIWAGDSVIKFSHHTGICRGESYWFLNLYLKAKDQFSNPRAHLAAIADQFKDGGGMDPTLLQTVHQRKGKLLNLKIGVQNAHGQFIRTELIKRTPREWKANASEVIRQIKAIPAGAYGLGLPRHQTAFIKIDDRLGYFFDPNDGVLEIQGNELAEKLYDQVSSTLKATGETHPIFSTLYLDFVPVTLRA